MKIVFIFEIQCLGIAAKSHASSLVEVNVEKLVLVLAALPAVYDYVSARAAANIITVCDLCRDIGVA